MTLFWDSIRCFLNEIWNPSYLPEKELTDYHIYAIVIWAIMLTIMAVCVISEYREFAGQLRKPSAH